jgi:FkbM family methyltransferase
MRHARLQRLATGPWGAVVWLGISLAKSVRSRQPTRIYRDADGDWVQSTPRAAIACPELHLKRFESIERRVKRLWFRHYHPAAGDVIFDVGAGIGEDTIILSREVTPSGRVIAIEPSPRVFRCLQKTVRLNGITNVITVGCAVHSSDGELRISDDEFYAASTVLDAAPGERIPARSLGSLFDELRIQHVDLLKMNIEGAEVDALEGMASHRCAVRNVAISCHDFLAERGGSEKFRTRSRVVAVLEQSGFQMLPSLDDAPEDWARDYVYATRSQQPEPVKQLLPDKA